MKTIKIIDLFNKIANGEEVPGKIRYKDIIYEYNAGTNQYYELEHTGLVDSLRAILINFDMLNNEVEIIEEKKLAEKLGKIEDNDGYIDQYDVIKIGKKINEIIEYLESKEIGE